MVSQMKVSDVQQAMAWFKALSAEEKLHYRQHIASNDALCITRYWLEKIKQ